MLVEMQLSLSIIVTFCFPKIGLLIVSSQEALECMLKCTYTELSLLIIAATGIVFP